MSGNGEALSLGHSPYSILLPTTFRSVSGRCFSSSVLVGVPGPIPVVLVSWGCCNRYPQLGSLNNTQSFLTVLEAGNFQRVSAC